MKKYSHFLLLFFVLKLNTLNLLHIVKQLQKILTTHTWPLKVRPSLRQFKVYRIAAIIGYKGLVVQLVRQNLSFFKNTRVNLLWKVVIKTNILF